MFSHLFHTFLLSQIFGLYMVVMAIILLCRMRFYRSIVAGMKAQSSALIICASFGLLLGLFLVLIHNFWVMEPRVVITLLAWFILIKSILWLSLPEQMVAMSQKLFSGMGYYFVVLILAIVGIFLMTKGFYLSIHHM